jgi:hypothetical protein
MVVGGRLALCTQTRNLVGGSVLSYLHGWPLSTLTLILCNVGSNNIFNGNQMSYVVITDLIVLSALHSGYVHHLERLLSSFM